MLSYAFKMTMTIAFLRKNTVEAIKISLFYVHLPLCDVGFSSWKRWFQTLLPKFPRKTFFNAQCSGRMRLNVNRFNWFFCPKSPRVKKMLLIAIEHENWIEVFLKETHSLENLFQRLWPTYALRNKEILVEEWYLKDGYIKALR